MKCFFSVLFASVAFLLVLPVQAPGSAPGAPRILRTDIYPGSAKITFSVPFEQGLSFELPGTFDAESIRPFLPMGSLSTHSKPWNFPVPDGSRSLSGNLIKRSGKRNVPLLSWRGKQQP